MRLSGRLQSALHVVFPPQCLACGGLVSSDFALCPECWRQVQFIAGLTCDICGAPLIGEAPPDGSALQCDDCLTVARPWQRGRAALMYRGTGRDLVLQFKHADRTDLALPAGEWMARAAQPILAPGMIVAPVPLHWLRLVKRRYNQAALLAGEVARQAGLGFCPDLLQRLRRTPSQEGRSREGRFLNLALAIRAHPQRVGLMQGRPVLLVDDVMTSGATLAACTEACLAAGSGPVSVLVLARAAKEA